MTILNSTSHKPETVSQIERSSGEYRILHQSKGMHVIGDGDGG